MSETTCVNQYQKNHSLTYTIINHPLSAFEEFFYITVILR